MLLKNDKSDVLTVIFQLTTKPCHLWWFLFKNKIIYGKIIDTLNKMLINWLKKKGSCQ